MTLTKLETRLLSVAMVWVICLMVVVHAKNQFPSSIRFDRAIVEHARFEERLAKRELTR